MDSQLATIEISGSDSPRDKLSPYERKALEKWEVSRDRAPLSLAVSLGMYELFLNGHSCEEILRINKRSGKDFDLGMILDAALRNDWFGRREAHLQQLFDNIATKVEQTKSESVSFLSDMLSAAHRQYGDKLKLYAQNGDPSIFNDKDVRIDSLMDYRSVLNLLMQVTGQKDPDKSKSAPTVNVQVNNTTNETKAVETKIKSADIAELLKMVGSESDDGE